PTSCTTSENCDFLVTYNATKSLSRVDFELSGKGDWIALGFSDDQLMVSCNPNIEILMCVNNQALSGHYYATSRSTPPRTTPVSIPDTDILICASDTSLSGHYYATARTTPTRTVPAPLAVEISDQSFNGGVVSCRITREINPVSANFRNLEEQQFLLGAIGDLNGATIAIHSARRASSSRINVLTSGGPATTMQQGSFRFPDNCPDADCGFLVTYQASGDNSVVFELRGRGNWAGPATTMEQPRSFRFPDNCPDADCDFLVTYQASGDYRVVIELRGRGNWAGVGFSGDNQMPNTDILICASDTSLSGHYYATARTTPTRTVPNDDGNYHGTDNRNGKDKDGESDYDIWLYMSFYVITTGATIAIHSARSASSSRINVLTSGGVGSGGTPATTMQQGSFRFPDNCPDADCDFLVNYQASGDNSVVFELRGRGNWAGVGFSDDNQMHCPKKSSLVMSVVLLFCRITREVNPILENFRNLEEHQFLLGAIGGLSGATIGIHSEGRASSSRINVVLRSG
ncbi:unnamed protein product, partial [Porites lobata]